MNKTKKIKCKDCGLSYSKMGLDLVLPDQQWKVISPENEILCANCICKRAKKLSGIAVLAWVDQIDYSKKVLCPHGYEDWDECPDCGH